MKSNKEYVKERRKKKKKGVNTKKVHTDKKVKLTMK
jgi:hypothetical protein